LCKQSETETETPLDTEAPPVLPADVCKLPTRTFVKDVLDRFRGHIKRHSSEENLTLSRMTTKSWSMLPRMMMRSRRFWRATTRKYSSTTPGMRSRQKGGRYDPVRQVASVLWRARDRLPEHVRGGIGLLCRQVRTRQPTHRSRIVVFGWDHAFKAVRCTLQALLSIPAAPLHV
jgi:hypothetical protein